MAFDIATATLMVRNFSSFLSSKTDAEIQNVLNTQAIPRIRQILLTATDSSGAHIFYASLGDMADPATAQNAETLVDLVFDEAILSAGLRRVAAAFAAASMLIADVSIIESQQKVANQLEKMALAELDRLVKSQIVSTAVAAALPKVNSIGSDSVYIVSDFDPATVDLDASSAKPFAGAQEEGRISAIINGYAVQADVKIGDSPIAVIDNLARAIMAAQSLGTINLAAAPAEGYVASGIRKHTYNDALGNAQTTDVSYSTNLSVLGFKPYKHDNVVDVSVVTVYLSHKDLENPGQYLPGIKGLLYGTIQSIEQLSHLGPYSLIVDLKLGHAQAIQNNNDGDQSALLSDSLFFEVVDGGIPASGSLKYRINDSEIQTVAVTTGADAQGIVNKLAEDLAAKAVTQRLLGAVRPSCKVTVNGTPKNAPGLELICYQASSVMAKMVFHLLEVPTGVSFGVVPSTLITQGNWDNQPKSMIVEVTMRSATSMDNSETPSAATPKLSLEVAHHTVSPELQRIRTMIQQRRGLISE